MIHDCFSERVITMATFSRRLLCGPLHHWSRSPSLVQGQSLRQPKSQGRLSQAARRPRDMPHSSQLSSQKAPQSLLLPCHEAQMPCHETPMPCQLTLSIRPMHHLQIHRPSTLGQARVVVLEATTSMLCHRRMDGSHHASHVWSTSLLLKLTEAVVCCLLLCQAATFIRHCWNVTEPCICSHGQIVSRISHSGLTWLDW